ncbi:MAG: PAS-domain containing protein, partial [Rhodospirillaceae bacterium]
PLVMVCCWQSGRLRVQAADGEDVVSLEACEVFATAFRKVAHSTNQESGPLFLGALDQDPHFAQSDLVQGRTGMRFVAAMPLLSADETSAGDRFLGDVLVLDRQSRDLAAGELQALGDIAALAVDHLVRVSEQAQEARRIETQLRTTISTMTDALFVLDADQRFALFNDHYLDLLALPPALVHVGAPVEPVIRFHAERGDYGPGPVEELIQIRVDRLSAPVSVQTQLFIDGGKRILDLRKAPMEGGGAVVVATDVTERTKAEALLADQKAIIETVLENIDQGVLMVDAADGIKATNSRYAEMLDLPADWRDHFDSYGEIARYYYEKVHGLANSPEALEAALQTVRSRERLVTEVEIQDGRFVEVRQNPLSDGGIVRTYLDVTERKRVEQQIAQKEQHWRSLLETSNEGIWFIDNDALTTDINRSLSGILQREKQDVVGCYLYEFLDAKSQEVFFDQLEQRRKGNASSYEVVIERPDGSTIPVLINGTPMFDAWGRKIGSFGMVTDLTEVKKNERRLTDAYGVISDSINYASNIQR